MARGSWGNSGSDGEGPAPAERSSFDTGLSGQSRRNFAACCQMMRPREIAVAAPKGRVAGLHKSLTGVTVVVGADG